MILLALATRPETVNGLTELIFAVMMVMIMRMLRVTRVMRVMPSLTASSMHNRQHVNFDWSAWYKLIAGDLRI